MHYSEKLPRLVKGQKCQGLTPDGDKCKAKAFIETTMHGDPELNDNGVSWVRVCLCKNCALLWQVSDIKKQKDKKEVLEI